MMSPSSFGRVTSTLAALRSGSIALAVAGTFAMAPGALLAQTTNTVAILTATLQSFPSCLSYQVKGMCFFLRCTIKGCAILSSIRVSHYVPDAIVSTYNDPLMHPWLEVGKPIAATMAVVGSAMAGMPLDSAADTARDDTEITTFKGADAIGNPVGMVASVLSSGTLPNVPSVFGIPGLTELMDFPSEELPNIQREWMSVPMDAANSVLQGAASLAKAPMDIIGKISSLPGRLSQLQSAAGNVGSFLGSTSGLATLGMNGAALAGIDLGPLQQVVSIASLAGGSTDLGVGSLFCPGGASAFGLHYQSELDALFWRGILPVEMLYPSAWVPTRKEVSHSAIASTWGSIYPRTGEVVQQHPVKASAVLAERVASIIKKRAQPHIYKRLETSGGYKYFSSIEDSDTRWSMVYPRTDTSCVRFGENDSLSLLSFGDGRTSANGYVWNLWNKYDCCQNRGIYLFSVP